VRKGSRSSVYLRLVEAYRNDQGQVRHRVLRTLGREDELKTSGQLDQLAASFARLDPPEIGTRREEQIKIERYENQNNYEKLR
jgi:hypothetical protein